MLSVTGITRFYYLRDFTDMHCKHSRVLPIMREQLHREPNDGDVFIVMSRDRLKSTFERVWELEPEILQKTAESRFRNITDINQYLIRYWRLCSGEFSPYNVWKDSELITIQNNNLNHISDVIRNQRKKVICLNDADSTVDFDRAKMSLIRDFEVILPEKSSFEK